MNSFNEETAKQAIIACGGTIEEGPAVRLPYNGVTEEGFDAAEYLMETHNYGTKPWEEL